MCCHDQGDDVTEGEDLGLVPMREQPLPSVYPADPVVRLEREVAPAVVVVGDVAGRDPE
jgi:hypothetical protein